MSISPFLRSPMTDLTGGMISHQLSGRCQKEEMKYMDCLEAYGLDRGETKCRALYEEFHECHTLTKQFKRFFAIRAERDKQIAEGKLTGEKIVLLELSPCQVAWAKMKKSLEILLTKRDEPLHISPFFRSPFTDLTGGLVSYQLMGRCATMEMDMMDCLEAYGLDRGMKKCKDLIEEFRECHTLAKQFKRFSALRTERERQIAAGKLKGECRYVTPKIDSF